MKTLLLCTVLVMTFGAGASDIIVSMPVDDSVINITEAGIYTRITGTGMGLTGAVGAPSLPVYTAKIALPTGCIATGIDVIDAKYTIVRGLYNVMPAQTPVPFSVEWNAAPDEPDPEIYNSSSFYP